MQTEDCAQVTEKCECPFVRSVTLSATHCVVNEQTKQRFRDKEGELLDKQNRVLFLAEILCWSESIPGERHGKKKIHEGLSYVASSTSTTLENFFSGPSKSGASSNGG